VNWVTDADCLGGKALRESKGWYAKKSLENIVVRITRTTNCDGYEMGLLIVQPAPRPILAIVVE